MKELQKPLGAQRSGIARAITQRIRNLILQGKLPVGSKIPPGRELAERWGTNQFTIRYALAPLVNEGLLESRKRGGIIVCSRKIRPLLRTVAIYSARNFHTQKELQFVDCLHSSLHRSLARENIESALFIDTRDGKDCADTLPALQSSIDEGEVQGLVVINSNAVAERWLGNLPVEKVSVASGIIFNAKEMIRLSLDHLAKQGCQSVGLIFPGYDAEQFSLAARSAGLKTRRDWVRTGKAFTNQKAFGYEQYSLLAKQRQRPDGLMVYPDTVASGVLCAALQMGTRVPEELKIVLHRQTEMDYFCPLPIAWVENSVSSVADELIRMLKRQLAGEEASTEPIRYQIVENRPGQE